MTSPYDEQFYATQKHGSLRSAEVVVPILLAALGDLHPRSVCDFGCGVGTWLTVFSSHDIRDLVGIDGDHVPRGQLLIPAACFIAADLGAPVSVGRTFDLAVSLEVGEHIESARADAFVENLCRLAPVVLFSACPPTPRHGTGHINEQTQSYWARKFLARGFVPSAAIREKIWHDERVEWFYRQNIVLYVRRSLAGRIGVPFVPDGDLASLDVRHPEFAAMIIAESVRMRSSLGLLKIVVQRLLRCSRL